MDETKIVVTFVILKVRNPQFDRSMDRILITSYSQLNLGPTVFSAWIPAKRDNEYDVAFSQ